MCAVKDTPHPKWELIEASDPAFSKWVLQSRWFRLECLYVKDARQWRWFAYALGLLGEQSLIDSGLRYEDDLTDAKNAAEHALFLWLDAARRELLD